MLSIVLRALETRSELATIAAALVGGAWSVISLLAIPAIALEDVGPVTAIKRSAALFKEHWGGRVTGMAAIGGGVFLAVMLPALGLMAAGVLILSDAGSAGIGGGRGAARARARCCSAPARCSAARCARSSRSRCTASPPRARRSAASTPPTSRTPCA